MNYISPKVYQREFPVVLTRGGGAVGGGGGGDCRVFGLCFVLSCFLRRPTSSPFLQETAMACFPLLWSLIF